MLVLLTTLGGGCIAVGAFFALPPRYEVNAELYVSVTTPQSASGEELQAAASFARQSVISYARFVLTPYVLEGAVEHLEGRITQEDLKQSTVSYARVGTSIIHIHVAHGDPDLTYDAAVALVDEATRVIEDEQVNVDSTAPGPVLVEAISPPERPTEPAFPKLSLTIAMGLFFGLAVGVAIAVLLQSSNRSLSGQTTHAPVGGPVTAADFDDPSAAPSAESRAPHS